MSTEFDKFYSNQTPANAVALARADHQAYSGHNASEFIDALTKAEAQCNAHEALVKALDRAAVMLERVTKRGAFVVGCDAAASEARAALALAGEGV